MAQRRQSSSSQDGSKTGSNKGRRMSRVGKQNSFAQEKGLLQDTVIEDGPRSLVEQVKQDQIDRDRTLLTKYSRYLIQQPNEKCIVTFYHNLPNITYREVVEGIQGAMVAAYRPTDCIVSVELVPLQARCAEYYGENRWVVEMTDEEVASLLYRSDVYVRARKVTVMSLSQALSLERSREFRDQLRLKMQKGPPKPPAAAQINQPGRRMSRVTKLVDYIEDPKTAVQQQSQQ